MIVRLEWVRSSEDNVEGLRICEFHEISTWKEECGVLI